VLRASGSFLRVEDAVRVDLAVEAVKERSASGRGGLAAVALGVECVSSETGSR
jgi:hypothetical protein